MPLYCSLRCVERALEKLSVKGTGNRSNQSATAARPRQTHQYERVQAETATVGSAHVPLHCLLPPVLRARKTEKRRCDSAAAACAIQRGTKHKRFNLKEAHKYYKAQASPPRVVRACERKSAAATAPPRHARLKGALTPRPKENSKQKKGYEKRTLRC